MENKFYITSYPYEKNFEYIFGKVTSNLKELAENRGWKDVRYPVSFEIKKEDREVIKKGFFGREKKVIETRYSLFFLFEKELEENVIEDKELLQK